MQLICPLSAPLSKKLDVILWAQLVSAKCRQGKSGPHRITTYELQAEGVVAKMEEAGNALGDFGLSLVKLCKFEDDEGAALGVYTQQGAATKRISADCRRTGMVRAVIP